MQIEELKKEFEEKFIWLDNDKDRVYSKFIIAELWQWIASRFDAVVIKGEVQPMPNGGSEVITIDLIMLNTVKQSQKVLSEWNVSDSKINDTDCLNKLLEIMDNKSLVQYMNTIEPNLIKS